jgi:hypothetical protein
MRKAAAVGSAAIHCSLQWTRASAKGTDSRPNRLAPFWFPAEPKAFFRFGDPLLI